MGHSEHIQIGRYKTGQKYEAHYDTETRQNVLRLATVIVYLNDLPDETSGGYTIFPMGKGCAPLETTGCCTAPNV